MARKQGTGKKKKPNQGQQQALQLTAINGEADTIREMAASGLDVDAILEQVGVAPLALAAMNGHLETVTALLDAGAEVNRRDSNGWTALFHAMDAGEEMVRLLLERGADPNIEAEVEDAPEVTETPLLRALSQGDSAVAVALLGAGAAVSVRDEEGRTPLHLAVEANHTPELITALTETGADVDAREPEHGWTPLMLAAISGSEPAVEALLKAGANPLTFDDAGRTARLLAEQAQNGEAADGEPIGGMLDQLEQLGTALGMGEQLSGFREMMEAQLGAANWDATLTLLETAEAERPEEERLRLSSQADRLRAILEAIETGEEEKVALYLEQGGDPNLTSASGVSLLMRAAGEANPLILRLLLQAGADLHAQDSLGGTALLYATDAGTVRTLVEAGADANELNESFDPPSPLFAAVQIEDVELVRFLLERGADPEQAVAYARDATEDWADDALWAEDSEEEDWEETEQSEMITPLVIAEEIGNQAIIELLRAAGAQSQDFGAFEEVASEPAYREWVERLGQHCGQPGFLLPERPGVYVFTLPTEGTAKEAAEEAAEEREEQHRLGEILQEFGEAVRHDGYHLVASEIGRESRVPALLLLPTDDRYAVLATVGLRPSGVGRARLIARLKEIEQENPWELAACAQDYLVGYFTRDVRDPERLARELYAISPDIVTQGGGDVETLVESLRKERQLQLWWDSSDSL